MNKLNRFYLSQNISIDNALSMNQILHQIVNQIKEIVDFINDLELRANEYTDQEIIKLNDKLQAQLETLEQTLKSYTDDSIDTYNVDVINPQLTEIRNTIDTLNRTINQRITNEVGVLNRRIDSEVSTLNRIIEDTKSYLEDLIRKGMAYVYSSISGRHLPLQNVLDEIGNVLKQILSYNWNSIDEFKIGGYDLSTFNRLSTTSEDWVDVYSKIISTPPSPLVLRNVISSGNNFQVQYVNIGENTFESSAYVIVNGITTLKPVRSNFNFSKQEFTTYFEKYFNIMEINYVFNNESYTDTIYVINLDYLVDNRPRITFNSIKLTMQELNVNWNAVSFTGVNTFYELNETEKLYDTLGITSDYFVNNKYKIVHNNFESDFFKSNINEENGGN